MLGASYPKKGEKLPQFNLLWLAAILADFKGFGIFDRLCPFFSVLIDQRRPKAIRGRRESRRILFANGLLPSGYRRNVCWIRDELGATITAAFIELGFERLDGCEFFFHHIVNGYDNVSGKRIGSLEFILRKQKNRILG